MYKRKKTAPKSNPVAKAKQLPKQKVLDSINEIVDDEALIASRFDLKKPYLAFLNKKHPELLDNVDAGYFYEEKDIDLDGRKEVVIAFENGPSIERLFVLRNKKGKIEEIANWGYANMFYDVKLISFYGTKPIYICFESNYNPNSNGNYLLYEFVGNKLKDVYNLGFYAILVDIDNDGLYDGAIDTCPKCFNSGRNYYEYTQYFSLENDGFKLVNMNVSLPNYPNTISNVLIQYLMLKSSSYVDEHWKLKNIPSEVNQRLRQLCLDKEACEIKIKYADYLNEYKEADFSIKQNNNRATATLINGKKEKLFFQLEKLKDKWHIVKINKGRAKEPYKLSDIPPDYPEKIEDVLLKYISLRSSDNSDLTSEELVNEKKQISELCIDKNASKIKWNKSIWQTAYTLRFFRASAIKFSKTENKNNASVIMTYIDNKTKSKYQLKFELHKSNEKWQITKVELL